MGVFNTELRKCPFCGKAAEIVIDNNSYAVFCTGYDCNAKQSWFDLLQEAIEAWNRREDNG